MQRRIFLKLSAVGASSVLWGCQDESSSVLTHGPKTEASKSAPGGSVSFDVTAIPSAFSRSVFVRERDAALTAFDTQGYSYEIEPFAGRVIERGMFGLMIRQFGSLGLSEEHLNQPVAIAFGADDNMYVVDRGNSRIQVFDRDARYLRQIGRFGAEQGELSYPRDALFDADGRLVVADTLNHRIQILSRDGKYIDSFGQLGTRPGELNAPIALALSNDGFLHVLEAGNRRVQVFSLAGRLQGVYAESGDGPGQLALPRSLVVAKDGTRFVADVAHASIDVFAADGSFEKRVHPRFEDGSPAAPIQLALAPDGDLYVTAVAAAA